MCRWLLAQASTSGVVAHSLSAFTSAPNLMSTRTAWVCPRLQASCRGVQPALSLSSTSPPSFSLSRSRSFTKSPRIAAACKGVSPLVLRDTFLGAVPPLVAEGVEDRELRERLLCCGVVFANAGRCAPDAPCSEGCAVSDRELVED